MAKQMLAPYDLYCRLFNDVPDQAPVEDSNASTYWAIVDDVLHSILIAGTLPEARICSAARCSP